MIRSFRCKETEEIHRRHRSRKFANIEKVARRKLKMLDDAEMLEDASPQFRETASSLWRVTGKVNTAFGSTISGASVFAGGKARRKTWRSLTTIREVSSAMTSEDRLPPIHPGEILREEFLVPLGMSAHELALALRVPATRINDIVNEKRGITADTALRLSRYFATTAKFWLNLQASYELEVAEDQLGQAVVREVLPRTAA